MGKKKKSGFTDEELAWISRHSGKKIIGRNADSVAYKVDKDGIALAVMKSTETGLYSCRFDICSATVLDYTMYVNGRQTMLEAVNEVLESMEERFDELTAVMDKTRNFLKSINTNKGD